MKSLKHILFFALIAVSFLAATPKMPVYEIIIFEGSDWCVKCISLEKNVLSDSTFVHFIQKNDIELKRIDFPQRKKQKKTLRKYNESVAEAYQFDGTFPTLLFINNASNQVSKISYNDRSTQELIQVIRKKMH